LGQNEKALVLAILNHLQQKLLVMLAAGMVALNAYFFSYDITKPKLLNLFCI